MGIAVVVVEGEADGGQHHECRKKCTDMFSVPVCRIAPLFVGRDGGGSLARCNTGCPQLIAVGNRDGGGPEGCKSHDDDPFLVEP